MTFEKEKEQFDPDKFDKFTNEIKAFAMDEDGQVHSGIFKAVLLIIQILQIIYKLKK